MDADAFLPIARRRIRAVQEEQTTCKEVQAAFKGSGHQEAVVRLDDASAWIVRANGTCTLLPYMEARDDV